MNRRSELLTLIARVAEALGEDAGSVVFVGGGVVALYGGTPDPRLTEDVDLVAEVTLPEYYELLGRLRRRGFRECSRSGAPVCRLELRGDPALTVDVMPVDPAVLGFSNRWYREGVRTAEQFRLPGGRVVRALSPLYFLATKLEAFRHRGKGDFGMSHDLEDVLVVLSGMPTLFTRIEARAEPVAEALFDELGALASDSAFLEQVPWHFSGNAEGQALAEALTRRLQALAVAYGSRTTPGNSGNAGSTKVARRPRRPPKKPRR